MELKSNGRRVFRDVLVTVVRLSGLAGTASSKRLNSLLILFAFFFISLTSYASTITSKASGNWNSTSTWNGGVVPGSGDAVTISSGNTVTVNVVGSCNSLTVKGTLNMSANLSVAGAVNINSGGTLSCGSNTLSISGSASLTNSGTFSAGTGTIAFSGTSNSTTGTIAFNDVTVNTASISFGTGATVNGDLTLIGGHGMSASPTYGSSSTLKFDGSYTVYSGNSTWPGGSGSNVPVNVEVVSGTLSLSWNTLTIKGSIIADAGATFDASTTTLTFAGSSPTMSGSGTISLGAITIGSGCTFTMASDLSIGSLTVNSGGTFKAASYDLTITGGAGSITNNGTFNAGTGTVIFTPQWVGSATTGTIAFNNVICNSAVTFNTGATINGYLQLNGVGVGTSPAYGSSAILKVNGDYTAWSSDNIWPAGTGSTVPQNVEVVSGTFACNKDVNLKGTLTVDAGAAFSCANNSFTFAGTSNAITGSGTVTLGDVAIGSTCVFTLSANTTFNTVTINSGGVFNCGSYTLTLKGGYSGTGVITNNGTFNAGTGTVAFIGTSGNTSTGTITYNNVSVSNAPATFNTGATVNGNLTLNAVGLNGSPAYGSSSVLQFNGSNTIYSSSSTWPTGSGSTVPVNIEVMSGTVTLSYATRTIRGNITVDNGATFDATTSTLTFAGATPVITGNASFGDVIIASGCNFSISNATTFNSLTINTGGTFNTNNNTLTLNGGAASLTNNGTFNAGTGTVNMYGTSGNTIAGTITLNNVDVKNTSLTFSNATTTTVNGTLTLDNTGSSPALSASPVYGSSGRLKFNGGYTIYSSDNTWPSGTGSNVAPYIEIAAGTLSISSTTRTVKSNLVLSGGTISGGANLVLANGATIDRSNGVLSAAPAFGTSVNMVYSQAGGATTTGPELPTSTSVLQNLTINNSNGVTLGANATVNGTLTFTSGILSTGTYTATIGSAGSISGAGSSAYVNGKLAMNFSSSKKTQTFTIGSSTAYAPVTLTFASVTASGNITASTTNGDQPNIASACLVSSKSVNRYWTLTNTTVAPVSFSATFNFVSADLDANATYSNFVVARYASSAWTNLTTGTKTATSTAASSITAFGDFQVAESGSASINTQPSSTAICPSTNTSFSVVASGAGLSYQWKVNTGSGWTSLSNTGIYSGATTATLSLTGATSTYNGYKYECVVSSSCGSPATSSAATLTINSLPAISSSPSNVTICQGNNATFTVSASGTGVTYQWQEYNGSGWSNITNGGIYSGATTASLTLTAPSASLNTYQYKCVVSGTCTPGVTSNAATLTINTAPSITSSPSNATVCPSGNTSFSVNATGTSLTYQWQVNTGSAWTNLSNTGIYTGTTTATLTLNGITSTYNNYQYRCVVSGTCTPAATSAAATLTVNTAPSVTSSPSNVTICSGGNATFSVSTTGTGLTYQWQEYNGSSWSNITNGGVYSGATSASLTLTGATNAYQYKCIVSGTCSPSATSSAATLTINTAPSITSSPGNVTICSGGNTTFSVSATGTGLTYQWQEYNGTSWSNITNGGIYSGATTSSLTLTGATNAYQYRCIVSGTCSPSATSSAATLTINTVPSITSSPGNVTICSGGNATFSVSATGTALTYQWQEYNGTSWSNITNGGIYSGATTSSLTLTGATNAYQYRCIVSGTCSPSATSSAATLTINAAPSITSSPSNVTICSGGNATFSVSAIGTSLAYQWQSYDGTNWNDISGATSASLTLTGATTGGQYRCVVSGTCSPSATSSAATLTINTAPSVTSSPSNVTICSGGNATFSVSATGTALTYQWQEYNGTSWSNITNGGIYSGATTASLTLTGATNAYQYRCIVSGTCSPSATSTAATLSINTAPSITSSPSNVTICSGGNATFSVSVTGTGLTYQWQEYNGTSWSNITNGGIYSGATTASLTLTGATNAYQYRCIVSGTCSPSTTSSAATLTINAAPSITSSPSNVTICSGGNATFSVSATGTGLTYQWQEYNGTSWSNITNGGIYSGATTASLTLTGATNAYQYRCIVSGTCSPSATSSAATLTINAAPYITSSPSNVTICSGGNATFSVSAIGTSLAYQWQSYDGTNWNDISGATSASLTLTGATTGGQYRCVVSGTCSPSATSSAATLTINTAPSVTSSPSNVTICSGGNATFSVSATGTALTYQWQEYNGTSWSNITNGGIYSGATTASLTLTGATNAYQYRCIVSGTCSPSATSSAATLTINTLPSITSSPGNVTICSGDNATFSVSATGTSLAYQWQSYDGTNWNDISGATSASLTLTGATSGGQYRCVVSGTCGSAVTTSSATLNINTVPTISSNPGNSTICAGANTSLTVSASGTSLSYQWQENAGSSWSNLSDGGVYSGTATATLSFTGATASMNGYQYRCIVSGTCSPAATSSAATLTVNSAPSIASSPSAATACAAGNASFIVNATGTSLTYQWQENTGSSWANITNGGIYSGATTATLSLTGVTAAMNTYQYRCVVSGTCSPSATSSAAMLSVTQLPIISSQPLSNTTCPLSNAVFSVTASSTASLSYQWQVNDGTGWSDITATNLVYTGYTTNTLTLTAATSTMSGYTYRCLVSNCSGAVTTNAAVLTVLANGTWIGGSSKKWNDPANWCGGIPSSNTTVYIDSTASNMPVTDSTSTISCNDLVIYKGAKVTMGNNLKVNGTLYLYGQLNMAASDTLTVNGLIVYTTGQMTGNGSASIIVSGTGAATTLPGVTVKNLQLNRSAGLYLGGDVTINGTLTLTSGKLYVGANTLTISSTPAGTASNLVTTSASSLNVAGTSSVTIPSSVDTLNNLTINNSASASSGAVQLNSSVTVNGSLTLTKGYLNLGTNNLTISSNASISGYDSTKYIISYNSPTTGGVLKQSVSNNNTDVIFPLGTNAGYAPIKIKLTAGSTADQYSIRVFDGVYKSGTSGTTYTTHTINKTWYIDEGTIGGSNATLTVGWTRSDENSGLNRSKVGIAHYTSGAWNMPSSWGSATIANNAYWVSRSGITSFSPFTTVDSTQSQTTVGVNVKVFLQGPFSTGTKTMSNSLNTGSLIPTAQPYNVSPWSYTGTESVKSTFWASNRSIVDWVLVELRTGTASTTKVAQRACFIKTDGTLVDTDGVSAVAFNVAAGNYYIVIKHRNHLSVMTASAVSLAVGGNAQYDFTTALSKAYGSITPMKLLTTGYYGMYAGDGNANGSITAADYVTIWRPQNGHAGYQKSDYNMNGSSTAADYVTYWRANNGKATQVP